MISDEELDQLSQAQLEELFNAMTKYDPVFLKFLDKTTDDVIISCRDMRVPLEIKS